MMGGGRRSPATGFAPAGETRYIAGMFLRPMRRGFTLLEICIVIFIAVLLMSMALPSLSGLGAQRRLQGAFDRFDALAVEAQRRSLTEGKPYVLVWGKEEIRLYPADWTAQERRKAKPVASFAFWKGERFQLDRTASLSQNSPSAEWTFWPTGNCEPVTIRYAGPSGEWDAAYNPLSARASLNRFVSR
jgi:prepilin-type N-terminal cleavage/methylation domain-containing protein